MLEKLRRTNFRLEDEMFLSARVRDARQKQQPQALTGRALALQQCSRS